MFGINIGSLTGRYLEFDIMEMKKHQYFMTPRENVGLRKAKKIVGEKANT